MDDNNTVSTVALVLLAVLPTAAGAVLTALFTYLSQRRIDRREHARWLRQRRFDAYRDLLRTASAVKDAIIAASGFTRKTTPWREIRPVLLERYDEFSQAAQDAGLLAYTYKHGEDDEEVFVRLVQVLGELTYKIERRREFAGEYEIARIDTAFHHARQVMAHRFANEPKLRPPRAGSIDLYLRRRDGSD